MAVPSNTTGESSNDGDGGTGRVPRQDNNNDEFLEELTDFTTADLYDQYMEKARIVPNGVGDGGSWKHYGGRVKFMGRTVTIKCFEDNSRLKELAFSAPPLSTSLNNHGSNDKAGDGGGVNVKEPRVLVVDAGASMQCAMMGDLIAQAAHDNGWRGVIISGCVRDVAILRQIPMGIYAMGSTPRKSTRRGKGQVNCSICLHPSPSSSTTTAPVIVHPNDIIFCDEDGILILDPNDYDQQQQHHQANQERIQQT